MNKKRKNKTINKIFIRSLGGDKSRGLLQIGNIRLPCALGRAGISAFKREGDGTTPRAAMHLLGGFRKNRQKPPPRCNLQIYDINARDGWCDAPYDRNYNRPVRLPYPAGTESLCRTDSLYDMGFILDWNWRPRVKGRGSAIFLHIARPKAQNAVEGQSKFAARKSHATSLFHPTAGCIAVSEKTLYRLMPYFNEDTEIIVLG